MLQFLIKRTDGDWFDVSQKDCNDVLRPSSWLSKPVDGWGDHRIEVEGCKVSFSYEYPGLQVVFECETLSRDIATQIVDEIAARIVTFTGQQAAVMEL